MRTIVLNPPNDKCDIFFTSDLHFTHRNVISFCNRPFNNEKHMDNELIDRWNSVVRDNDKIFVLGDLFWFNDSRRIANYLDALRGELYIIPGNHDNFAAYHRVRRNYTVCDDITRLVFTVLGYPDIYLSHYPLMTWPGRDIGSINLFGHIHSSPMRNGGFDQDLPLHPNQMDVGCDRWGYTPIRLDNIIQIMNTPKIDDMSQMTT